MLELFQRPIFFVGFCCRVFNKYLLVNHTVWTCKRFLVNFSPSLFPFLLSFLPSLPFYLKLWTLNLLYEKHLLPSVLFTLIPSRKFMLLSDISISILYTCMWQWLLSRYTLVTNMWVICLISREHRVLFLTILIFFNNFCYENISKIHYTYTLPFKQSLKNLV